MYPSTLTHNYYTTLAEPATTDPDNNFDQPTCTNNNDAPPKEPPIALQTKCTISHRKVNWATKIAKDQDKPTHIANTATTTDALQHQYHACLKASTYHRTMTEAILDSGANGHYGSSEGAMIKTTTPSTPEIVGLANGTPKAATVKALLPYNHLPETACTGDIIPGLKNDLISIGKLADAGYTAILHSEGAEIYPRDALTIHTTSAPVLRGCRDTTGLWRVNPTTELNPNHAEPNLPHHDETQEHTANAVYEITAINTVYDLPSIAQAMQLHHASLGFPIKDPLTKAIANGHFEGWPLLTQHNITKHYPESDETIMGHTNQQRQGVRSTKPKHTPTDNDNSDSTVHVAEHSITATVYQLTNTIYSDQTGRLPCQSQAGYEYIMAILHTDSYYAFVEPMKNKSDEEQQHAYRVILQRIKERNLQIDCDTE